MHRAARCLRPDESTALEALREETESIAIPPQHLHPIAPPAAKHKQLTRKRIFGELGLHKSRETIEPVAQIRETARELGSTVKSKSRRPKPDAYFRGCVHRPER